MYASSDVRPFGQGQGRGLWKSDTSASHAKVRIFPGPDGLVNAEVAHLYVVEEFSWVTSMGPHTIPIDERWLR